MKAFDAAPGITVLPAVEDHDSADEAYTQAKDFITSNSDLKGLYLCAGGSHGAAQAITELGKTKNLWDFGRDRQTPDKYDSVAI
jgi:ABC-type sugar transport system substrate-binding protein